MAVDPVHLKAPTASRMASSFQLILQLFKLRIVLLLLFSAFGGAVLAAGGWPGGPAVTLLFVTGGLSAAGASAINQYLERDRDMQMVRTRNRPIPSGAIKKPVWVLFIGSAMIVGAVGLSALYNPPLAISNAIGALIYIGVYTIWLKPRTIMNIVIGGAAGSMAVISGGAASHAWADPGVILLALLVFAWTPTHFWCLAMAYRKDYAKAGYPMLPVLVSMQQAAKWVAVHSLLTGILAMLIGFQSLLGPAYWLPVLLITAQLFLYTYRLLKKPDGKTALDLFKYSNIYLALIQFVIIILPPVKLLFHFL